MVNVSETWASAHSNKSSCSLYTKKYSLTMQNRLIIRKFGFIHRTSSLCKKDCCGFLKIYCSFSIAFCYFTIWVKPTQQKKNKPKNLKREQNKQNPHLHNKPIKWALNNINWIESQQTWNWTEKPNLGSFHILKMIQTANMQGNIHICVDYSLKHGKGISWPLLEKEK